MLSHLRTPASRWLTILLLFALAGCASAAASPLPGPPRSPRTNAANEAAIRLAALVAQTPPSRNLYQLTDQLKLRPPKPIAHVVRTTSPNYPLGHRDNFWVLGEDQLRYFVLHATIRAETPHLYIYVQNGLKVSQAALTAAATHFERSTYPTDRSFFGSEWLPGVDGDPHITCLLGNLKSSGAAGFYSAEDEYPPLVYPYSNAREMFYINTNSLPGSGEFDVTLAHEFQHMIHWHVHSRDNAWLNEGMSMVAQRINGYPNSVQGEADTFLGTPSTQLNTWSDGDNTAHYGGAYLFLIYLYDRFGRTILHDMVADHAYTDFQLVSDVLHKLRIKETADQVFADWIVANAIDNGHVAGGKYAYRDLTSTVLPTDVSLPGVTPTATPSANANPLMPLPHTGALPPYATDYYAFPSIQKLKPFRLQFNAATTVPLVSTPMSAPFWWSNRGDLMDTRLVRSVDLSHVHSAHLHFQAWYNVEDTYDYAYVEVSADAGKTWTTMPAPHTSRANPTGANWGNGYTGNSHAVQSETVDLSSYAGKKVEIRFEYITDDEVNLQGFVLKNMSIPEIGLHDTLTGWTPHGFVPVARNSLLARWNLILIETTAGGVTVRQIPVSSGGTASVSIDPAALHLTGLRVAVFMTAPKTTVRANYTLTAG
jgi:hypothetical protein